MGNNCTLLPASWTILPYLETFPAQAAFEMLKGFCTASRIRAWLSGWQIATLNRSVPPVLPSARISCLSLCLPRGLSLTIGCRAALAKSPAESRTCALCLHIVREWSHSWHQFYHPIRGCDLEKTTIFQTAIVLCMISSLIT